MQALARPLDYYHVVSKWLALLREQERRRRIEEDEPFASAVPGVPFVRSAPVPFVPPPSGGGGPNVDPEPSIGPPGPHGWGSNPGSQERAGGSGGTIPPIDSFAGSFFGGAGVVDVIGASVVEGGWLNGMADGAGRPTVVTDYTDGFENGIIEIFWRIERGEFTEANGMLSSNTNGSAGSIPHAITWTGVEWADVYASTILPSAGSLTHFGVLARISGGGAALNGYLVRVQAGTNLLQLYRIDAGAITLLATGVTPVVGSDIVGVRCVGTSIDATIGAVSDANAVDATYASGLVGLAVTNTNARSFRTFWAVPA